MAPRIFREGLASRHRVLALTVRTQFRSRMMNRRWLHRVWPGGAAAASVFSRKACVRKPVRYEAFGSGPVLLLGFPIGLGPDGDSLRQRYLDRLTDRYKVIVMDYPPTGRDAVTLVEVFTPDLVCADMLSVADAAGADRFAWYGYSWGGLVGLQLAARTDRLTALVCGGFPPFGASYRDLVAASEAAAERALPGAAELMVTFFRRLEQWRDREAVANFTCPKMTFAGREDIVVSRGAPATRIGPLIEEHQAELEQMGWTVRLVNGYRHELFARPDVVVPLVRDFLDPVLLQE
jgi:pimeloyl-ACP methyl ester carboxylesterase